jgi:hypothetical protein
VKKLGVGAGPLLHCHNHPELAATLRCDECRRLYCRDCVVERWVTSRSSVWVCRRCTGGWRPTGDAGGASPVSLGRYTPLALIVGAAALVAVVHTVLT